MFMLFNLLFEEIDRVELNQYITPDDDKFGYQITINDALGNQYIIDMKPDGNIDIRHIK